MESISTLLNRTDILVEVALQQAKLQAARGEEAGDPHITLHQLQEDQGQWSKDRHTEEARRNHMARLAHLQEELGELARVDRWEADDLEGRLNREAMDVTRRDAVGDVVIVMAAYCNARELDLEAAVHQALREIRDRPDLEVRPSLPASRLTLDAPPVDDGRGWSGVAKLLSSDGDGDG